MFVPWKGRNCASTSDLHAPGQGFGPPAAQAGAEQHKIQWYGPHVFVLDDKPGLQTMLLVPRYQRSEKQRLGYVRLLPRNAETCEVT